MLKEFLFINITFYKIETTLTRLKQNLILIMHLLFLYIKFMLNFIIKFGILFQHQAHLIFLIKCPFFFIKI